MDAMLIDIFPSADTLPLGKKHSGTKLAVGLAAYRGFPQFAKCRCFSTVCIRKYIN